MARKAKPLKLMDAAYVPWTPEGATHIQLHAPGPFPTRIIPVAPDLKEPNAPCWKWNGDVLKPTLSPSLLTWTDDVRCHSFIREGRIQFLQDCSHELAGQTVDLLDIEE
jgi:hypothetical protein